MAEIEPLYLNDKERDVLRDALREFTSRRSAIFDDANAAAFGICRR